jgi:hypothetical protein
VISQAPSDARIADENIAEQRLSVKAEGLSNVAHIAAKKCRHIDREVEK